MNWIENISNSIETILANARIPMQNVPALPLYCESELRPGLSATSIASKIISRLPEIGIPNEKNPDGSENLINKLIMVMCEEIVNAIKDDAVVMTGIPPMKISVTGTGANAGGPVQIAGYNSTPTVIKGVMQ